MWGGDFFFKQSKRARELFVPYNLISELSSQGTAGKKDIVANRETLHEKSERARRERNIIRYGIIFVYILINPSYADRGLGGIMYIRSHSFYYTLFPELNISEFFPTHSSWARRGGATAVVQETFTLTISYSLTSAETSSSSVHFFPLYCLPSQPPSWIIL